MANELSKSELSVWHAFKHMGEAVMTKVERDLTEIAGLTGSEFGVLSRLVDLGDGELRQQSLADSMGWQKSRLSHQLTRMQERGYIRRSEESPRSVMVAITALGREKIDAARPVHAHAVKKWLLDRLSANDRKLLSDMYERLLSEQ